MAVDVENWLSEDKHRIVLIDMVYHNGAEYGLETFSSYPYIMPVGDTFVNVLEDTVSDISYDDIISAVPNIISGITKDTGIGTISLFNTEGEYDYLVSSDQSFEGQTIQISIGEPSWLRDDFINILDGIIDSISAPSIGKINITIKDKKGVLDVPLQTTLIDAAFHTAFIADAVTNGKFMGNIENGYASTQAWSSSLSVLPEATENTHVPICLGKVFNIEPVLIDSYNHIYFVHEGLIESVDEVRANGVVLTVATQYEVDLALGAIRLLVHDGGAQITCDITGQDGRGTGYADTSPTKHSTAYLIEWLLLEKTSLTSADISNASFISTGFTNDSIMGYYSKSEDNVVSVCTKLINSLGGYMRFTKSPTVVELIQFIDPEGESPDLYLVADEVVLNGISISSIEQPKKSITFGYKKNWTVQSSSGLAGLLTTDDFGFLDELNSYTAEYSTLYSSTLLNETQYPLAEDQELIPSLMFIEADANTELNRRIALRGAKRFIYKIKSVATPFIHNIGDIINITHFRYGFEAGKNALIIGMEENPIDKRVTLEVWL